MILPNIVENGNTITRTDLLEKKWLDNDFYGVVSNFYGNFENLNLNLEWLPINILGDILGMYRE